MTISSFYLDDYADFNVCDCGLMMFKTTYAMAESQYEGYEHSQASCDRGGNSR